MMKCPYNQKCGGCNNLDKIYDEQINIKTEYLRNLFRKELHYTKTINKIIKSPNQFFYRNKSQNAYCKIKGIIKSGMYEEATHKIIDVDRCLLVNETINGIQLKIQKIIEKYHIPIYDEDKKTGIIRHVLVKHAIITNESLVVLVIATTELKGQKQIIDEIIKNCPTVKSIILNYNPKATSSVLGIKEKIIYGPGFIYDYLLGLKFKITARSFYQINHDQTENLYKCVIDKANLNKEDRIIDAYSGVGTIGIIVSSLVKEVLSVEKEKEATKCGFDNCKLNKITNVKIINDDATSFLQRQTKTFDCLIMDPPRSGSTTEFIDAAINLKIPKIIYVSCNPETLVRDLKLFNKYYNIDYIQGFDMFPNTNHIETVCLLTKK